MTDLWNGTRDETDDEMIRNDLRAIALVFVAYLLHSSGTVAVPKAIAVFFVLGALVLRPRWLQSWRLWLGVACLMLVDIVRLPFHIANHHYVLTYVSAALTLSLTTHGRNAVVALQTNARWLLVGIMGFAVVHKLASEPYVDGSYLAYMIANGSLGDTVLGYCSGCTEAIEANRPAIAQLMADSPLAPAVELRSPLLHVGGIGLLDWGRIGAVLVIVAELWIVLLYAFVPKHRMTHISTLVFVCGLAFVRQELVFISTVATLGLFACQGRHGGIRRLFAFVVLLATTLSLAGVSP